MAEPTRRILICETCDGAAPGDVAQLREALRAEGLTGFEVGAVACMGACAAPLALAVQGDGRATFVFDGVDLIADAADIASTARAWLAARDGWIEDGAACGRLRERLRARTPALPRKGD